MGQPKKMGQEVVNATHGKRRVQPQPIVVIISSSKSLVLPKGHGRKKIAQEPLRKRFKLMPLELLMIVMNNNRLRLYATSTMRWDDFLTHLFQVRLSFQLLIKLLSHSTSDAGLLAYRERTSVTADTGRTHTGFIKENPARRRL